MALYQVDSVEYGYKWERQDVSVLKGVSLEIPERSFVCLVGPSGSGKTTLLNLLGLLDRPHQGRIRFLDRDVASLDEHALGKLRLADLGFVFQAFYLIPTLSVLENTTYFLAPLGIGAREANERGEEVLKAWDSSIIVTNAPVNFLADNVSASRSREPWPNVRR